MVGSGRRRCDSVLGNDLLSIHSLLWLLSILLLWRIRIQILLDSVILMELSVGVIITVAIYDIKDRATR